MGMPGGLLLILILQINTGSTSGAVVCGHNVCPLGMDCINGISCADPCDHYTALHDEWRSTNYTVYQGNHCDRNVNWQGWYRLFLGQTSAHIPERCVADRRCGTYAPMWITEPHPTQSNEIVSRTVCPSWSGNCCYVRSYIIQVKLCYGNYYVYKLVKPSICNLAYCAEVNRTEPAVASTTSDPRPQSSTITHPPTSTVQHLPHQPSQLICGRDKLQVGLDLASMTSSGLNPFTGNLAARNCSSVRVLDGVVWYEVEAQAGPCGNTLTTNNTHAIYSNTLFIYPMDNTSFAVPVSLPFSCAYPLDTSTSLNVSIRPFLELAGGISGSGAKARASMFLFRNSTYTETYPAGQVTLPVGSPLYVGVSVDERDTNFAAVLKDCYATHSSNPDDPVRYSLIQNKCPTDRRQVSVVESGSSRRARFSALFFLPQGEYRDVFLHCSLRLCDQRSSSCVPSCTRRARRSLSTSAPMKPLTIGPIMWDKSPE
ncbi:uromodulin-like [Scomber japonicus]|uniref:uromodulin-like n=1 Tax=Scomber japonicus TaxID=13676 RepID=UPI002305170C|nr:uromodulin-like [Scomber japonicus]